LTQYFAASTQLKRALWATTKLLLFRFSPTPFFGWRRFLLKVHGASIGIGARIYPSADIWAPWNLSVGAKATIGPRVNVYSMDMICIGDRSVISQDSHLVAGSHDYRSISLQPNLPLVTSPIFIGIDCWICAQAFVLPGVSIGDGSVIGARSVVSRDQPTWMVCAGNPCRPLKKRLA
jgi:putative colanic acid biosynthesis acetyltransferase WcaF